MRYLPLTPANRTEMLAKIGVKSVDDLFVSIPKAVRMNGLADLPLAKTEMEVETIMNRLASQNISAGSVPFFVGAGAYKHHVPATVDHLIQRSEFLTSYTPYQPEIAQGTLQYLFEFQTQVARLTHMDVANASMYDGSTAAAEAVMMAHRVTKRSKAVIAGNLHPHYRETIETVSRMAEDELVLLKANPHNPKGDLDALMNAIDETVSCVVIQTPDFFGNLHDFKALSEKAQSKGVLVIAVFTEVVALGAITPHGAMGADIVVGEGQSIGNSLNYGGPYIGLFTAKEKYLRQMPGRLCGETTDADGKRGFVLTLSTREQHIRREKATSNICTNSGLCVLAFTIHMTLLGEKGMKQLAAANHASACILADELATIKGVKVLNESFFNEFTIDVGQNAAKVIEKLAKKHVLGGVPVSRLLPKAGLDTLIVVASTEVNSADDRAAFIIALKQVLGA